MRIILPLAGSSPVDLVGPGGLVLAALGIAATVIGGVVIHRRQFPKRRLEWSIDSQPLIAADSGKVDGITVLVGTMPVPDPYINTFTLRSNSRADVPSSSFDASKPIKVRVEPGGAMQVGVPDERGIELAGGHGEGFDWAELFVEPQLIRAGAELEVRFVSSGKPEIVVTGSLIDIAIANAPTLEARRATSTRLFRRLFRAYLITLFGLFLSLLGVLAALESIR